MMPSQRESQFARIVDMIAFVLFAIMGLYFIAYAFAADSLAHGAFGLACVAYAKAAAAHLKIGRTS